MAPPVHRTPPPTDVATFRDLLLFEERLKSNAMNLQSRKSRYQLFLVQLLLLIVFLLVEVLLPPEVSLLAVPYRLAVRTLLPHRHTATPDAQLMVHPYVSTGLLFVSVTTLVLFFASGMYEEKISYANKYVPHANRALRSFNMYLNVRKPPLRPLNPLAFFFPRDPAPPRGASRSRSRSPSPPASPSAPARRGTSIPIPAIPPATNPRGELIFSSRVDRAFREGYERHRAAFERRREERERGARGGRAGVWAYVPRWGASTAGAERGVGLGIAVGGAGAAAAAGEPLSVRGSSVPRRAAGARGIVMKQKRRERSLEAEDTSA